MANATDPVWATEDEQDVRPYAVTGGRTEPRYTLRLASQLAAGGTAPPASLVPEAHAAFAVCRDVPRSVAEIAATLRLPALVTKIVLSDLIGCGALVLPVPAGARPDDPQLLEAVLAGLHTKFSDAHAA